LTGSYPFPWLSFFKSPFFHQFKAKKIMLLLLHKNDNDINKMYTSSDWHLPCLFSFLVGCAWSSIGIFQRAPEPAEDFCHGHGCLAQDAFFIDPLMTFSSFGGRRNRRNKKNLPRRMRRNLFSRLVQWWRRRLVAASGLFLE